MNKTNKELVTELTISYINSNNKVDLTDIEIQNAFKMFKNLVESVEES